MTTSRFGAFANGAALVTAIFALLACIQIAGCSTAHLPQVQLRPSVDRPFIFIHQRKCGGLSVRDAVYRGAVALGLNDTSYISCFLNTSCWIFDPDPAVKGTHAIYAGHFNWYTIVPDDRDFSCLTTFRHPVGRVNSCISYLWPQTRRPVDKLANMTREEFRDFLLHTHHANNASCNNEALYMLSGVRHAGALDFMARSFHAAQSTILQASSNFAKCVVLVVNEPSASGASRVHDLSTWNARMVRHWFPWVAEMPQLNVNTHPPIPAHLVPVVHELNWPEMQVYSAALRQYKLQQEVLNALPEVVEHVDLPGEDWTPESVKVLRGRN